MPNRRTTKASEDPQVPAEGADDTEGHNLWISPSVSREMANSRNRDIERQARERQRVKEAQDKRR